MTGRTTRIVMFFIMLGLLYTTAALSQKTKVQSTVDERVKNLRLLCSLTDEQTAKVRDILTKADAKSAPMIKANKRSSVKVLRMREKEIDKQIEALLTPDQLKKYDSFKKARRDEAKGWRNGKGSEYNF